MQEQERKYYTEIKLVDDVLKVFYNPYPKPKNTFTNNNINNKQLIDWDQHTYEIPWGREEDKELVIKSIGFLGYSPKGEMSDGWCYDQLCIGYQVECLKVKFIDSHRPLFAAFYKEDPKPEKCPTCGSAVKVVGKTTMHYEPIETHESDIIGNNTSITPMVLPGENIPEDLNKFKRVIQGRIAHFETIKHHKHEATKLRDALNTILSSVPPNYFE